MKKKQILFLFLSLFVLFKSFSKNLNVGVSAMYPPFEYNDGELKGFDIDLIKLVGEKIEYKINFVDMDFASLFPALDSEFIDLAISTVTATPERKLNYDFSDPYYFETLAVIYKKESGPIEFKNKKIACQLGTTMELYARKKIDTVGDLILVNENNQAIELLKSGYVDYVVIDEVQAYHFTEINKSLTQKTLEKTDNGYAICFKKNSDVLIQKVNQALRELKAEGALQKLENKWITTKANTCPKKDTYSFFVESLSFIYEGLYFSLTVLIAGFLIGFFLGIFLSILRFNGFFSPFVIFFVSFIRGIPLILQLSILYFCLPAVLNIKITPLIASVISFGINSAAYISEIIRSGINAIPKGQFEAARVLGISKWMMWKDIIMPQVFRNILPALAGEVIALFKETAVVSVIGGVDIMRKAQFLASTHCTYFIPLLAASVYYYGVILIIEFIVRKIQKEVYDCF